MQKKDTPQLAKQKEQKELDFFSSDAIQLLKYKNKKRHAKRTSFFELISC